MIVRRALLIIARDCVRMEGGVVGMGVEEDLVDLFFLVYFLLSLVEVEDWEVRVGEGVVGVVVRVVGATRVVGAEVVEGMVDEEAIGRGLLSNNTIVA